MGPYLAPVLRASDERTFDGAYVVRIHPLRRALGSSIATVTIMNLVLSFFVWLTWVSGGWFAFLLLPTPLVLFLDYRLLVGLLNTTTIRVGDGRLLVKSSPIPRRRLAFDIAEVDALVEGTAADANSDLRCTVGVRCKGTFACELGLAFFDARVVRDLVDKVNAAIGEERAKVSPYR